VPSSDGGRLALAGFLYQMMGVHALQATACITTIVEDAEELTVLLRPLRAGASLLHESMGEDAAIVTKQALDDVDEQIFIQFKYSLKCPPEPIRKGDMKELADRFREAERQVQLHGGRVDRFQVITNRKPTLPANGLWQNPPPDDPSVGVYGRISVADDVPIEQFERWLYRLAREFGVRDDRIAQGINTLIGSLIARTVGDGAPQVTQESIIAAFTDSPTARKLTRSALREQVSGGIAQFRAKVQLGDHPVRRQLLDAIATQARRRALVVITGEGGGGKSAALWQWADEICRPPPDHGHALLALGTARSIRRGWPTELLCEWGNYSPGHARFSDREIEVVDRLRIANPDMSHPLLFLGLDGLDEDLRSADQRHNVEDLVRWFVKEDERSRERESPAMTLVVTCRSLKQFWDDFARDDVSGLPFDDNIPIANVPVKTFTDQELLSVAQQATPTIFPRIEQAVQLARGDSDRTLRNDILVEYGGPYGVSTVDDQVLEAIRHPVMWHAFLLLCEPIRQERALDGDRDMLNQIASLFVQRFIIKARMRGSAGTLDDQELHRLLHHIALSTSGSQREQHSPRKWTDPACETDLVNWTVADKLRKEGLSGGLISDDDNDLWRWRHKFVEEYLASRQP